MATRFDLMIYLDTHVVVWLYAGRIELIPPPARALIDGNDLLISPMVVLELQYLFETGRTSEPAAPVVSAMERGIGLRRCGLAFTDVVEASLREDWTRDPFDRIVVAQARLQSAALLTKDRVVGDHYDGATWDLEGSRPGP